MKDAIIEKAEFNKQAILLVEDNDDDVLIMQSAFRKASIPNSLQVVADGQEVIRYLLGEGPYQDRKSFPLPVVILLDLNMPKKNGLEVLAWIRENPPFSKLTVHILTASNRATDVARAAEAGANMYLIKPSRIEELIEMVRCWHSLAQFAAYPTIE
jgi:CheY-like chemotaxis protein